MAEWKALFIGLLGDTVINMARPRGCRDDVDDDAAGSTIFQSPHAVMNEKKRNKKERSQNERKYAQNPREMGRYNALPVRKNGAAKRLQKEHTTTYEGRKWSSLPTSLPKQKERSMRNAGDMWRNGMRERGSTADHPTLPSESRLRKIMVNTKRREEKVSDGV